MFDSSKPYKTRDGRAARIVADDYNGQKAQFRFLTIITEPEGVESITTHNSQGSCYGTCIHRNDLVNEGMIKVTKYLNLYFGDMEEGSDAVWGFYYNTLDEAKESAKGVADHIFVAKPIEIEQ